MDIGNIWRCHIATPTPGNLDVNTLLFSKGAKLSYVALEGLDDAGSDPRQQELDLGLPPLMVKKV